MSLAEEAPFESQAWADAVLAARLFAVDPSGLGGVVLRALPGPARDRWLEILRGALPPESVVRRVPLHVTDGRLVGGLDLAATLRRGRPVEERGLLVEADGGIVLLAMAERLPAAVAARVGRVLDSGEVALERDGLARRHATRIGVVALDEGLSPDERPPGALVDRLAFHVDLTRVGLPRESAAMPGSGVEGDADPETIASARSRLATVESEAGSIEVLCEAALALGIDSMRAPLLALRVARAAAALAGRESLEEADLVLAARLVLAPRATCSPTAEPGPDESLEEPAPAEESRSEPEQTPEATRDEAPPASPDSSSASPPPSSEEEVDGEDPAETENGALGERVLEAAAAALPDDLLTGLRMAEGARSRSGRIGRAGARRASTRRGRPIGVRRGEPGGTARLNVVETLRAAAPWQRLRREAADSGTEPAMGVRIQRDDFRVTRFRERSETTTIFVVDASGSAALYRLAEAKGAVELLLAESYVRRDRVALIAFRGAEAELLLPPTRSLARARRSLAGLPGGGGTPLAAGIEAAVDLAESVLRSGGTPLGVFLTDGQANVARDGTGGRARAAQDARDAARLFRSMGLGALWIDTSPRPQASARALAAEMDATYLPLPQADSAALCEAARSASSGSRPAGRA